MRQGIHKLTNAEWNTEGHVSRFRHGILFTMLAIPLVAFGIWLWENGSFNRYLDRWTWFRIDEVQLHSEWPLSAPTIKAWLPPLEGKSLLGVKPNSLIENLATKPWVENIAIKKEFPNRLLIDIETKRPAAITTVKGQAYFLDAQGKLIDKVTPSLLRVLDLPFLSFEHSSERWNVTLILERLERFKKSIGSKFGVSQVVLGSYPYFKIFLARPKIEVLFNFENWESQTPFLSSLLRNPPSQIGQPQRINLVFPKKAVVSPPVSH